MKRSLSLTPLRNAPALTFEYDDETGAISGRDADTAAFFIESAERARFVAIEPHPSSHRLGPTPHSAADLAAIFAQWYELPDWLDAVQPRGEPEADDEERAVELIY